MLLRPRGPLHCPSHLGQRPGSSSHQQQQVPSCPTRGSGPALAISNAQRCLSEMWSPCPWPHLNQNPPGWGRAATSETTGAAAVAPPPGLEATGALVSPGTDWGLSPSLRTSQPPEGRNQAEEGELHLSGWSPPCRDPIPRRERVSDTALPTTGAPHAPFSGVLIWGRSTTQRPPPASGTCCEL